MDGESIKPMLDAEDFFEVNEPTIALCLMSFDALHELHGSLLQRRHELG